MKITAHPLKALVFILALASSTGLYTNHGEGPSPGRPARIEGIRAAVLRQLLEGRMDWRDNHLVQEDVLESKLARRTLAKKDIVEDNVVGDDLEKVEPSVGEAGETNSLPEEVEKVVETSTKKAEKVDSPATDAEKVEPSPEEIEKVEPLLEDIRKVKSSAQDAQEVDSLAKNVSRGGKWERNTLPRPRPDEVPVGMRPLRIQPPILNMRHEFRYPVVRRDESGALVVEEEPGVILDSRPLALKTPPAALSRHDEPCGGTYTQLSGIISSPDYPFNYPNNVRCVYRIQLPVEYTVGLDCNDFAVQPGDQKCENDYLAVAENDLDVENMERYCGDKALALFSSTSNMTLVFQTDDAYRYRGFMCRYRALNPDGTGADGTVIVNTTAEEHPTICTGPGDDGWQGKCGVSSSDNHRIVGGRITGEHQFPWMVAVLKVCGREMDQYCNICGGTVVNPRWILTGAHCIVSVPVEDLAMLLGDHNLYTLTPSQKFFRVETIYIHPDFNVPKPLNNDVALAGLPQEMAFGKYVAPICLPPRSYVDLLNMLPKLFPGNATDGGTRQVDETPEAIKIIHENLNSRNISVYGWGTIDDDGDPAQRLRQVSVTVLPNSECEYYYGEVVTERMMCTSGAGGRGPCRGDSGSPAQMQMVDGRWVQVGVLAFGAAYGCEVGFPSGNVLLPLYIDWIEFVTGFDYSQYY